MLKSTRNENRLKKPARDKVDRGWKIVLRRAGRHIMSVLEMIQPVITGSDLYNQKE